MTRAAVAALLLGALLSSSRIARADDMPPLYLYTWLPLVHKEQIPLTFPPCPLEEQIVCTTK